MHVRWVEHWFIGGVKWNNVGYWTKNIYIQGITCKGGARPALFPNKLCCSMYCLCVNVYCTTATGCQPNCSWQIYQISNIFANHYLVVNSEVRFTENILTVFCCAKHQHTKWCLKLWTTGSGPEKNHCQKRHNVAEEIFNMWLCWSRSNTP
jgi:hypothetical protein